MSTLGSSCFALEKETNPRVRIQTNVGDLEVELFKKEAPLSVENFLTYTKNGHYNGTIFHRVIKNFMIQGGGFTPEMEQKETKAPIKNEASNGMKNQRGTLAMARTMIVDSATSQFFINTVDNPFLDYRGSQPDQYGYAVFGKVVDGMDVVDEIAASRTGFKAGHGDVPLQTIIIEKVEVL